MPSVRIPNRKNPVLAQILLFGKEPRLICRLCQNRVVLMPCDLLKDVEQRIHRAVLVEATTHKQHRSTLKHSADLRAQALEITGTRVVLVVFALGKNAIGPLLRVAMNLQ